MEANKREPLRISVEVARDWFENKGTTILDVVDPESFIGTENMVKGSVRIDPREIKEEYDKLSKDDLILSYCT